MIIFPTYGSSLVAEQLDSFGIETETYFVFGAGHEFYGTSNGNWVGSPNTYWDTVFTKVRSFYYDIHKPTAAFSVEGFGMYNFVDESFSSTSWYWDFGDDNYSAEQNPTHEYDEEGYYKVTQFVQNNNLSWDTTSVYVDFFVGVEVNKKEIFSIYPNPANNLITIENKYNNELLISITSSAGVKNTEFELSELQSVNIVVSEYKKGIYFVKAVAGNIIFIEKLVIK